MVRAFLIVVVYYYANTGDWLSTKVIVGKYGMPQPPKSPSSPLSQGDPNGHLWNNAMVMDYGVEPRSDYLFLHEVLRLSKPKITGRELTGREPRKTGRDKGQRGTASWS